MFDAVHHLPGSVCHFVFLHLFSEIGQIERKRRPLFQGLCKFAHAFRQRPGRKILYVLKT